MITLSLFALLLQAQFAQLVQAQLDGVVVRAATNEPVAQARILLTKAGGRISDSITAASGDDGKFSIANIPAGTYRVFSDREDYLRAEYGQSRPGRPGSSVTLAAGQHMKDVMLVMMPTGVISGRVLDQFNEPLSKIYVQALKAGYSQGARVLTAVMETQTNDLGEYRFYELPPGTYFVSAAPYTPPRLQGDIYVTPTPPGLDARGEGAGMQSIAAVLNAGQFVDPLVLSGETYVATYYPGTIDAALAKPLELKPASTLSGIDLRTTRIPGVHVRGEIVDENGQPVSGAAVSLTTRQRRTGGPPVTNRSIGALDLSGLMPGSYVIRATTPALVGNLSVDVGSENIDNARLVLSPRFSASGRITIEGRPAGESNPAFAKLRVLLESPGAIARANVQPNGEFTIASMEAGEYRISLTGLPANSYLKTPNTIIRLDTTPTRRLELIVSPNAGGIEASVPEGSVVVIVPDPPRRAEYGLYRVAVADKNGRARIDGIPPGDYKAFAWDDIDDDAWQDSEILLRYEDRGEPVRIEEGAMRELKLTVIR